MVDLLQRRGFQHGDGVGVLSPNRPEVFYVQTAPLFAGGRYTALHPMGSFDDHKYACDEAELRFLFVDPAYAERGAALKRPAMALRKCSRSAQLMALLTSTQNFPLLSPLSCSLVLAPPVISHGCCTRAARRACRKRRCSRSVR